MSTNIEVIAEDIMRSLVRGDHLKQSWCEVDFNADGEIQFAEYHYHTQAVKDDIHDCITAVLRRVTLIEVEEIDITDLDVPKEAS